MIFHEKWVIMQCSCLAMVLSGDRLSIISLTVSEHNQHTLDITHGFLPNSQVISYDTVLCLMSQGVDPEAMLNQL